MRCLGAVLLQDCDFRAVASMAGALCGAKSVLALKSLFFAKKSQYFFFSLGVQNIPKEFIRQVTGAGTARVIG